MSDDGEMWAAIKEEGQKKRWKNFDASLTILQKRGIKFQILNESNAHCRIGKWDFWPTTGKFINRKTHKTGRGVFNLIKEIENRANYGRQ
jgi:hypothetical protein